MLCSRPNESFLASDVQPPQACDQWQRTTVQSCQSECAVEEVPGYSIQDDSKSKQSAGQGAEASPSSQDSSMDAEQQLNVDGSQSKPTFAGWFAKCRGCGCMTAHEQLILGADVPFCRRCQSTLYNACPVMKAKMVTTLLYVHNAWSNAGL